MPSWAYSLAPGAGAPLRPNGRRRSTPTTAAPVITASAGTPTSGRSSSPSSRPLSLSGSESLARSLTGLPTDFVRTNGRWMDQSRQESLDRLTQRRHSVRSKLDRAYDDYLEGRLSQSLWIRKSAEWETELTTIDADLSRLSHPTRALVVTGERILELAKTAHSRYLEEDLADRGRLLDSVLSNTFDCGTLCPTYTKPFDQLARANETGNWRREWDSNPR
jgi:hypothetical protein